MRARILDRPRGPVALLTAVLGLVVGLSLLAWQRGFPTPPEPEAERPAGPRGQPALVEFERFSARRERSVDGERLSISLRLRTGAEAPVPCFVFVVARNDHATPKRWSIWPPQPAGPSITPAGHFHGATPASGHPLTLTSRWERITATVPNPAGTGPFDTVVVYVLTPDGKVLLARPFRL